VAAVLDFTSALYLGLRHSSSSLRPWPGLTTGRPAALEPPPGSEAIASGLAGLVGCESATLAASTLHLFWDLFGILARDRVRIFMDQGTYATARWGIERAAARGVPVRPFPHHDAAWLRALVDAHRHDGRRPIVVSDGFCPSCGAPAPLGAFLRCIAGCGGRVVLDDTQALGILGKQGGGSLRLHGIQSGEVIIGCSLAKGFGVPMAVLAGSADLIRRFEAESDTRMHCSPPSVASLRAAEQALAINRAQGGRLRRHLAELIRRFRAGLNAIGVSAEGGSFPVQTLKPVGIAAEAIYRRLLHFGVRTVLVRRRGAVGAQVAFLITALHRASDIDRAIEALGHAMKFKDSNLQVDDSNLQLAVRRAS
jgi:8-amino-7-oxononanoate synthase